MNIMISKTAAEAVSAVPAAPVEMSPRTRRLLEGPILSTLLLLAWPNVLVMMAQASTGLIETWWVSRLGVDALTGMALVFPGFMMMTMLSAGAIGGGYRLLSQGRSAAIAATMRMLLSCMRSWSISFWGL